MFLYMNKKKNTLSNTSKLHYKIITKSMNVFINGVKVQSTFVYVLQNNSDYK